MLSDCDWHFDAAKDLLGSGYWYYTLAAIVSLFLAVLSEKEEPLNVVEDAESVAKRIMSSDSVRRTYTVKELNEVIANPQAYNSALVERCKQELIIRREAIAFKSQVAGRTDKYLSFVVNSGNFDPAYIYCCQWEQACRKKERKVFWAIHGGILLLFALYLIFIK